MTAYAIKRKNKNILFCFLMFNQNPAALRLEKETGLDKLYMRMCVK